MLTLTAAKNQFKSKFCRCQQKEKNMHLLDNSFYSRPGITYINTASEIIVYEKLNNRYLKIKAEKVNNILVNPKLYFSLVKSKMIKSEKRSLDIKLRKLQASIKKLKIIGNHKEFEKFVESISIIVSHLEVGILGYTKIIKNSSIRLFQNIQTSSNLIIFDKLETFPKEIPNHIIKKIKKDNIFDELWVLYVEENIEEKIEECNPILFGKFKLDNNYFYICDWENELGDLTLNQYIKKLPIYDIIEDLPIVNDQFILNIKNNINEKYDDLNKTVKEEKNQNVENHQTLFSKIFNKIKFFI